jgi:disulfide bond formation protein DsbB
MDTTVVMSRFFALLTIAANLLVLGAIVLLVAARRSPAAARLKADIRELLRTYALPFAWLVALTATIGSLYYSEVANFVPCKLCWYQRIAMYPLVVILGIAAIRRDVHVRRYVVPVVGIGAAIAIFHYYLQRFPESTTGSCDPTAPCTSTWVWQFNFVSIPFMALSAFALIATLLLMAPGHPEPSEPEPDDTSPSAKEGESHELSLSSTHTQ